MANLSKLYLHPKNHKWFSNVPGRRPVISIRATATKKTEFLYIHLKPLKQSRWPYFQDCEDFIHWIKMEKMQI